MKNCKQCGAEVEDGAKFCDKCGARLEWEDFSQTAFNPSCSDYSESRTGTRYIPALLKNKYDGLPPKGKKIFWAAACAFVVLCVLIISLAIVLPNLSGGTHDGGNVPSGGTSDGGNSPASGNTSENGAGAHSGITYASYEKIETGMSYSRVCEILGEEGKLSSSASNANTTIQIYTWTNDSAYNYAIISISFNNGKVTAKSQVGL